MNVVSISGLQGTGKTTLALALGRALGALVLSRDPIMDVLHAGGIPMLSSAESGVKSYPALAYDLQTMLLRTQLTLGQSVVLECIATPKIRHEWERVADQEGAAFWLIDTICSDAELHRQRFQERGLTKRGDWTLTWETVEDYRARYRPDPRVSFLADSVNPVDKNVAKILEILGQSLRSESEEG